MLDLSMHTQEPWTQSHNQPRTTAPEIKHGKQQSAIELDKLKLKPIVKLYRLDEKSAQSVEPKKDEIPTSATQTYYSDSGSSTIIYSYASMPGLLVNDLTDRCKKPKYRLPPSLK